jgi:hypothetical protein
MLRQPGGTAVYSDGDVQRLGFRPQRIDFPVIGQTAAHFLRIQGDADKAQFFNRTACFLHGEVNIFQRNDGNALEATGVLAAKIGQPVIEGPGQRYGEFRLDIFDGKR